MALAQQAPPPGGPPPGGPGGPGGGFSRGGPGGMMMGNPSPASAITPPTVGFVTRGATMLSLDQDQTTKLTALLTKSDADLAPLRMKLGDTCAALRAAVLGATYDEAKIKLALDAAQAAETALVNAELKTWVDLRAILTADQITKLQSSMGQRAGGNNRGGGGRNNNNRGNNPPPGGPPPGPAPAPAN